MVGTLETSPLPDTPIGGTLSRKSRETNGFQTNSLACMLTLGLLQWEHSKWPG